MDIFCKKLFAATSIPQDKYVAIATTHLVGNALAWWQATLCTMKPENRMGLNEFIFPSWQDFEKEITTRFRRAFDVLKLYEELKSLRQVGTVEEYNTKFSQIEIRFPKLDQEAKMCLYIAGLGTKVSSHVVAKEPCSLQEAMKMAAVFGENRFQALTEAYQPADMMDLGQLNLRCFNCDSTMHLLKHCSHQVKKNLNRNTTYNQNNQRNESRTSFRTKQNSSARWKDRPNNRRLYLQQVELREEPRNNPNTEDSQGKE